MWKKDMQRLIDEQAARIDQMKTDIRSMEQQLDDYRTREKSIVSTLSVAHDKAEAMLADAEHNANVLLAEAKSNAEALTADAASQADTLLDGARRAADETQSLAAAEAERLLSDAKARVESMLSHAKSAAAEYETVLKNYNAAVAAAAAVAAENAARFASFIGEQTLENPGLSAEISGRSDAITAEPQAGELPDPEDSPAQLMQNIYALQSRVPPDASERAEEPVQHTDPDAGQVSADACADAEEAADVLLPDTAEEASSAFASLPESDDAAQASEEDTFVPTVNHYVKDDPETQDIDLSLDALLDEIIKAGEKHNG